MKKIFSNQGSTLVEIMIALGLVGLVTLSIFSLSQETLKNIQSNKLAATRDQLATQFRQSAGSLRNLRLSLKQPENQQYFFACICGKGAGCTSAKSYTLALYEDAPPYEAIKRYYDYSGIPCNPTAENCAIRVTINFIAQCKPNLPAPDPTAPASCVNVPVEFFAVTFKIDQNPSSLVHGNLFKSISGSAFTQVSNLVPPGSGYCP